VKEGGKFSLLVYQQLCCCGYSFGVYLRKKLKRQKKKKELALLRKRIFRRWFCWKRVGAAPASSETEGCSAHGFLV